MRSVRRSHTTMPATSTMTAAVNERTQRRLGAAGESPIGSWKGC